MKDIYVYMSKEAESRACNPCFRSSHFQSVLLGLWHYCGDFGWSPGGLGWFLDEIRIFLISGSWGHGFLQNLSSIIAPHYKKMQQASEFWTCCTIRHFLGLFSAIRPPPIQKKNHFIFWKYGPPIWGSNNGSVFTKLIPQTFGSSDRTISHFPFSAQKGLCDPKRWRIGPEFCVGGFLINGGILSYFQGNLALRRDLLSYPAISFSPRP